MRGKEILGNWDLGFVMTREMIGYLTYIVMIFSELIM